MFDAPAPNPGPYRLRRLPYARDKLSPDDIMTFDLSEREKLALTASPLPTMTKITIRCRWRQPSRQALATPYRGYAP